MNTRGLITLPVDDGNAAIGRYHHYDSYPRGLGVALFEAYQAHKSFYHLIEVLIFEHPGGWETIVDRDWTLGVGYVDTMDDIGRCCEHPKWRHYAWAYPPRKAFLPETRPDPAQPQLVLGHAFDSGHGDAAACYCHPEGDGSSWTYTCVTEHDSDWCQGTDCMPDDAPWVYRLYPQGVEVWSARQPDADTSTRHYRRARVSWDDPHPRAVMGQVQAGLDLRTLDWEGKDAIALAVAEIRKGL